LIAVACDHDCDDVELFVRRPGFTTNLAYDIRMSPEASVTYLATTTELVNLVVRMAKCTVEPCRYGLAVFVR
jgi:hypothetical protein